MAAQSVASLAALSDFLDFSKEPTSLLETFLYSAAFSPRPSGELLRLVLVSTSTDPHSVSARREQQLCLPGKGKYGSAEIHLSAYGIILCAVNEVLVMGVDAS